MDRGPAAGGIRGAQILGGVVAAVCGLAFYWLLAMAQEAVHPTLGGPLYLWDCWRS